MSRTGPVGRWRSLSKPQRTELYVRWSLYLVAVVQPLSALLVVGSVAARREVPTVQLLLAVPGGLVAAALNAVLFRTGLDAYLGRRPRPYGWVALSGAVSIGTSLAMMLSAAPMTGENATVAAAVPPMTVTFWLGAVVLGLSVRETLLTAAGSLTLLAVPLLLTGAHPGGVVGLVVGCLLGAAMAGATVRCSSWTAKVVWELDEAREAQARLAVAEERLRFSRDLHDVLGRNLATIALKSELAVQLARRQRPEAVDQMTEVQRIAQDSQREVREVVRGYRTVELHTELIGAASVLRAANVDCRTELAGTDALPAEAQSVLGWVVREAATNVLRHSEAANCSFRLRVSGGTAVLEVENDGVPAVPPSRTEGAGSGLRGLRERLAAHGGTLTAAGPGPGRFRVTAELPMAARESVA
ncbi:sensor histidine kinase [Kitasatospora griseola]|uniref:sensor histidine kinase n=1 Tax=Kitasatospora griseola TaxID=2064 RepID=UPI001E5FC6A7|nr:sensor histidine kinase [Kitasatospora griseola]